MRVAVATEHIQRLGGTETYLSDVIPSLARMGHEVSVFAAGREPYSADTILGNTNGIPTFLVHELGKEGALQALRDWKPDIIYAHGMLENELEARTAEIAKTVFFVHVYHGTCVSGQKRFRYPTYRPCHRTFGPACLLHYHLRGCGGKNPITMVQNYFYQKERLQNLLKFDAVVTHSFHMYEECAKHGVDPRRLHRFAYIAKHMEQDESERRSPEDRLAAYYRWDATGPLKVLFAARLDNDKGAGIIIETIKSLCSLVNRPIELTVVGDGPNRKQLERESQPYLSGPNDLRLKVRILGWLTKDKVHEEMKATDVVAFGSLWPEPFGLVGPESMQFGKPVAAFDVGGVNSWLVDNVNGVLAPGDPPKPLGLAVALAECAENENTYRRLALGAIEMSDRFERIAHLNELERIFRVVIESKR